MVTKLAKRILEVAYRDGMGHIPSALSILDIVWTLYDKVMTKDDQFILSKGHGCMALYAVLEEKGLFDWSTKAQGHPKRGGAILASTGSLGHGLPMAVGLAKAKKIKGESGRVFCLIGDGECNEGTIWESALLATHHKLDNLTIIIDNNRSSERALTLGDYTWGEGLYNKFDAFGFQKYELEKGNDEEELQDYLSETSHSDRPLVIICNTIKGNGFPILQSNEWHNRKLDKETYEKLIS